MAKKYRVKDKNGKYIVTQIYGGHAADGQRAMDVNATLMGKTPAEHCAEMIKKAGGKGNFETKSISHDACNLPAYSFFNGMTMGPEYNYHYKVCEEIELTFKLNNKIVTEKELVKLKGGDNVVITANQEVTWTLLGNNKLEKLVQGKASYSFTMPKTGKFNIKATGKCDPSASKSVAVQIAPQKPKKDFPRDKFIQALYAAMKEFDITSDNDRAGFLANVDHETGGFNGLTEGEDKKYSLERWKEISINQKNIRNWLAQHSNNAKAEFAKLSEKDKMNIMYNGMNGNIQPNDGWIYRGRGGIQLTGRGTYQGFADYIKRPDIMTNPDLIAKDIELAARSSAWYWKKYTKASKEAQKGDFVEARKAVNTDADGLRKTPILAKKYLKGQGTIPLRK
jgi:putative chitinase